MIQITHTFVSEQPASDDPDLVGSEEWNVDDYNAAIQEMIIADPTIHFVLASDVPRESDGAHIASQGYRIIGERFLDALYSNTAPNVTADVAAGSYTAAQK